MEYQVKTTMLGKRVVRYACHQCHNDLESSLDDAGKVDTCPTCRAEHEVPGVDIQLRDEFERQEVERKQEAVSAKKQAKQQQRLDTKRQHKIDRANRRDQLRQEHVVESLHQDLHCPYCDSQISPRASVCPHCRRRLYSRNKAENAIVIGVVFVVLFVVIWTAIHFIARQRVDSDLEYYRQKVKQDMNR